MVSIDCIMFEIEALGPECRCAYAPGLFRPASLYENIETSAKLDLFQYYQHQCTSISQQDAFGPRFNSCTTDSTRLLYLTMCNSFCACSSHFQTCFLDQGSWWSRLPPLSSSPCSEVRNTAYLLTTRVGWSRRHPSTPSRVDNKLCGFVIVMKCNH